MPKHKLLKRSPVAIYQALVAIYYILRQCSASNAFKNLRKYIWKIFHRIFFHLTIKIVEWCGRFVKRRFKFRVRIKVVHGSIQSNECLISPKRTDTDFCIWKVSRRILWTVTFHMWRYSNQWSPWVVLTPGYFYTLQ